MCWFRQKPDRSRTGNQLSNTCVGAHSMKRIVAGKLLYLLPVSALALAASSAVHAQTDDSIPPNFRGQITYDGSVEGSATAQSRSSNRIGFGGFNINIPSVQHIPVQAHYHAVIIYDGNNLRGTDAIRGNVNGTGSFTGTRDGDTCYLVSDQDGRRSTNHCTMSMFATDEDYTNPQGQHIQTRTEANRTAMVDFVERDRQAALAQAAEKQKAEQEAAFLASRPKANGAQTSALSRALAQDSTAWSYNRYDGGSLRGVIIIKSTPSMTTIRGIYTYNDGQSGWLEAKLSGGIVQCLEYWDNQGNCSPVRTKPQYSAENSNQSPTTNHKKQTFDCIEKDLHDGTCWMHSVIPNGVFDGF